MEQVDVLRRALEVLQSLGIQHMIVGSAASMTYGEPRLTRDIDLVVNLRSDQVDALCRAFPAPDYYVSSKAAHDAVLSRSQFNIIHIPSANKLDMIVAKDDPWGRSQLGRRRMLTVFSHVVAPVAAPEDVIIAKMIYYQEGESEKHLRDIASMLRISSAEIDRDYVNRWAAQLDLTDVWQTILTRTDAK
jgi:hypothetical protein